MDIYPDKKLDDWSEWEIQEPTKFYITSEKTMNLQWYHGQLQQQHIFYRFQPLHPFENESPVICVDKWSEYKIIAPRR